MELNGIIIKGIGGFYYVEAAGSVYECRARGVFRKRNIVPTVGDRCTISLKEGESSVITDIEPRKNCLVRPPVANIEKLFVVVSACSPSPNTLVIDRVTAAAESADIEPIIVITKTDLAQYENIADIYTRAGFKVIAVDYATGAGIDEVKKELTSSISAFAGNTGVGKSTLINAVEPSLSQATGEISDKLGRGRHTTRQVELFRLSFGGMIADTPGFSSFDAELASPIEKEQLQFCFREFEEYIGQCRFTSCAHLCEKGCAVVQAVQEGIIPASRHESYIAMYEEAKNIKPWENKK